MKKQLLAAACLIIASSCQKSLEEKAAEEAREFTLRECPAETAPDVTQDSMVYDASTRTLVYYYTLTGRLDDKAVLDRYMDDYERQFRQGIMTMPALRPYADNGFAFRYVYHSKSTGEILIDFKLRPSEEKHI